MQGAEVVGIVVHSFGLETAFEPTSQLEIKHAKTLSSGWSREPDSARQRQYEWFGPVAKQRVLKISISYCGIPDASMIRTCSIFIYSFNTLMLSYCLIIPDMLFRPVLRTPKVQMGI